MILFAGPSVPAATRARHGDFEWRAPAVAGDLLALIEERPAKVLLIDGLFDERAAVRHKEAIALMAAGTKLYGAASMGALRAAELAPFGMVPLGRIARAYRDGRLVGDDEVALVHGDARIGWKAISVAMVDVRATLMLAVRRGVIDCAAAKALRERWHDIHFVDRDWPSMITHASGVVSPEVAKAIASMHVTLKEQDASEAIAQAARDETGATKTAGLERTWFYDRLVEGITAR